MKCPKCNIEHNKTRPYCSRKCANSRTWTEADKLKKSISATNNDKVKAASNLGIAALAARNILQPKMHCKHCLQICSSARRIFCSINCYQQFYALKKTAYQAYRDSAHFKFNIYLYPENFDLSLIEQHGWYYPKTNENGVSRDHMVSVKFGFDHGIDPKIISHPANCNLIFNNDNKKKRDKCTLTIDELIVKIQNWQN